jgi:probable HAF family extracellular repeat protein
LTFVILVVAGAVTAAPQYYLVTDLGNLGGIGSFGEAINSAGVVVGYTDPPSPYAFIYGGGTITDLGQGATSRAYGIDGSLVVGWNSEEQAFLDNVSTGVTTLLTPSSTGGGLMPVVGRAYGVNAAGQVVGSSTLLTNTGLAALWTVGSGGAVNTTYLGALGGDTSSALAINESGLIAGWAENTDAAEHAVVWTVTGGTATIDDLGTLGGAGSRANAINNSGQVAGEAATADGVFHAFLCNSSGGMSNLDAGSPLGETASDAYGINAAGSVVGAMTISGANHGFLYHDGTMTDLNSVINSASGWVITEACGINGSGQITGSGTNAAGQNEAVLLTPALQGDANLDGKVDINDLTIVLSNYGQTGASWMQGCMDGDPTGSVDINDLTIVLSNYGGSVGASAGGIQPVPEPGSLLLIAAGLAGWLAGFFPRRRG